MRIGQSLLLVIIAGLLLSACSSTVEQEQKEDLALQQEVIRQLEQENEVLRQVNDRLRGIVIECMTNASRQEEIIDICIENYPPLRNETLDSIAPRTHVPIEDILVSSTKVIIDVPDLQEGIVAASRSMEPYLDENDILLERAPASAADIHEGDVIVFDLDEERIVHRVIEIGHDGDGWYARTKGDNNLRPDPQKVRFAQVKGIVIGVIY